MSIDDYETDPDIKIFVEGTAVKSEEKKMEDKDKRRLMISLRIENWALAWLTLMGWIGFLLVTLNIAKHHGWNWWVVFIPFYLALPTIVFMIFLLPGYLGYTKLGFITSGWFVLLVNVLAIITELFLVPAYLQNSFHESLLWGIWLVPTISLFASFVWYFAWTVIIEYEMRQGQKSYVAVSTQGREIEMQNKRLDVFTDD